MPNWGTPAGAFYGGSSFNVTKSSKNPAAAAKFIEFLTTNPEAIKARGNTGSAFLAFPGLTPVAQKAYDASYFGNDIYAVFNKAYSTVTPGLAVGPQLGHHQHGPQGRLRQAQHRRHRPGGSRYGPDGNGGRPEAERSVRQRVVTPAGLPLRRQPSQLGDPHGHSGPHHCPAPQAQCSLRNRRQDRGALPGPLLRLSSPSPWSHR